MPPEAQPGEAFGLLRSRHLQAICKSRISDFISNWIIKLVDETASCVRALGLIFVPMYFMNLEGGVKGEGRRLTLLYVALLSGRFPSPGASSPFEGPGPGLARQCALRA